MTAMIHRGLALVKDAGISPAGAESATSPASRKRRFVASNERVDSYNTVIKADSWDLSRFAKNPIVQLFHSGYTFPVGTGRAAVEGTQLMLEVEFAPADDPVSGADAEQALRWIDRGVMGVSVGFRALEYVYNEGRETGDPWEDLWNPPLDFTRTELYEVSVVNVPANPDALPVGRSIRSVGERFAARMGFKRADAVPCKCAAAGTCCCSAEECTCGADCSCRCAPTEPKAAAPGRVRAAPLAIVQAPQPTAADIQRVVADETEKQIRAIRARLSGNLGG